MQKVEVHSLFKYFRYSLSVLLLNFCIISSHAQLPYSESFRNATAADLIVSGVSGDAFLTVGSVDPAGQGYLRLTNNQNYQSGYVRSTTSFPSVNGLSISFDYFTHGGTGGDGISFFLYDASVGSFNIGAFGGSLGYAQNFDNPGVSKGFLALGLDEFGNFSNPNAGRQGGPGRIASSVVLRGDGNGIGSGTPSGSNYEFLTGISTNNTSAMTAAGAGGVFQVAGGVNGRTVASGLTPLNTGYRRAKIDLVPNTLGSGFVVNVWITEGNSGGAIVHHVIKNYSYIPTGPTPANLSYGFSAGTGSATNFHEIRNLEIVKPIDRSTVPVISNLDLEGIENAAYSFSQSDFSSKFTHFSFGSLAKIKVLNLPLHGVLKLNGTTVSAGQEINIADVSNLKFIPELDFIGTTNFQWNGSDGSSYALSDAFANLNILALTPTLPYSESFKNPSSSGLMINGTANSAELTSGTNDPAAGGYLRLTKNQINQAGYVYNTKNFPSGNGLAISFDYYSHGGIGSDGINFFLYDAAANPFSIGAFGGAMGYAQSNTSNGLSKGFIGLGLDDYGNFSSPGSGRQGGPGRVPGSVTLRGDGDGSSLLPSNFEYLKHIQTTNLVDMSGAGGIFELFGNKDSRTAGIAGLGPLDAGYRRIKMELVPNGLRTGFIVNVWITEGNIGGAILHHLIKDYSYLSTEQIPANLRYGFSASTGAAGAFFEVRNLEILLPSNLDHKPVVTNISKTGYEDQSIIFQNSDFQNSFFDPRGYNTLNRVEFTSLPQSNEGVLKLNGDAITPGQAINITDISAGKLSFTPVPNFHGTVSSFKWKGSTSSNTAIVPDHVLITVNPVNDSPAGTDKEILLAVNESDRVLTESDFGFTDPIDANLNTFLGVKIAGLPGSGTLKLNTINVVIGQLIPVDAISSGLLTFTPVRNEFGRPYTTFLFQVKDNGGQENGGSDVDQTPNLFSIVVAPLPTVVLASANRSTCLGTESVLINYNSVSGDPLPNIYNINWDTAANTAGLVDISDQVLSSGVISIDGLSNVPAGNYQGILTVRNSSNLILSEGLPLSILIRPLLNANISYGVNALCNSGKANVSLSGDAGGKYTSSAGLVLNELTGEIDLSRSIPGNYTVTYSLNNEVCSIIATTPLRIIALPVITNITGLESLIVGSTSQLNSVTTGGVWSSTNESVASVNSTGLVTGLKRGTAQMVYTVKNESCTDSVSIQINVSSLKAGDMVKIMNENKSILFSSVEFYNLVDSASRANYPIGNAIAKIRIESSPANGILKLNGIQINSAQEILYNELSELAYYPNIDFTGTDSFKWNWADAAGRYGNNAADVSISIVSNSSLFQFNVNENEIFRSQTITTGRIYFELGGVDAAALEINSSTGAITMNNQDYEFPKDSNSDNKYDFIIISKDTRGNSYSENCRLTVQNVREYARLSIEHLANGEIAENLKYISKSPGIIGRPIGKVVFSLAGTDSTLFKIDSLSGIVSMEDKDFESPINSKKDNVYEAGIQATDSDLNTAVVYWKVKVTNVLEVSQITLVSVSDVTIEENKVYGSAVPILNGKPIGKLNYTLTGNDSNLFKIDTASGIVSMEGKDYESASDSDKDNVFEVGVLAEDSDMNTAKVSWKVTVSDVKEVSFFSLAAFGDTNIEENKSYSNAAPVLSGMPIGKITYSLTGQDFTFFKIDTITGILSMESKDFESASDSDKDNVYEIGLKATDSDLNTAIQSWKVTVTNVKEVSSFTLALLGNAAIEENKNYTSNVPVLNGKPIGKVLYSLTGQDSIFFKIDAITGILSMEGKDFESASDSDKDNVYEIGLRATDSDMNTALQSWKVSVTNVKEVSSISLALLSDATLEENKNYTSNVPVLNGKPIGKVLYSLTGQDSNFFRIDAITGVLSMEGKDFESASDSDKDNVYEVGVKATDSDLNTAIQSWKVTVTNVREVSSITLAVLSDVTIEENKIYTSNVPVLIGKPMGKVVYTLIGKDSIHFNIDAISGIVSMEGKDFESASDSDKDNIYEVGVKATDFDMNTTSISWKVGVSNVQELSSFDLAPFNDVYIEENLNFTSSSPVVIGKPFGKLIYKLTGQDATLFKIDSLTGIVSMEAKDFESASDSDKNNVYEVGVWASDSDLNTSGISWKINVVNVKELSLIRLATISDVKIDEKKIYTSTVPVLDGNPIGKLTYSISGRDSIFFQVDKSKGIVSMQGRDFDSPQDFDKDNRYEICLIAKDSDGNRAIVEWKILVQLIRPSATHSMLSPEVNSILLNKNSSQLLTLTTKYANGDRYRRGGEQVVISKVSGSGTISSVTDHGDGTYSAIVKPDMTAGSGTFVASLAGEEVRNGNISQTKSTINYIPSSDAGLKSFTLSKGNLSPKFNPEVFDYITLVEYSVDSISLSPVVNEEHAKINVNGANLVAQNSAVKIPLSVGRNMVEVIITAQDGIVKKIYNLLINRSEAVFPYRESFMTDTVRGLVFGGSTNTARLTSGSFDVSGKGYLQLNRNRLNESGFVHNSQKFPSAKGLDISFEYYTYGGTGGDGLSFFLFDAKASFKIGAFGGSLGYAQNSSDAGLSKGFIGLGLDEYGEFSNTTSNKQGGPGRRASSVVIRGDGNGVGSGDPSRSNYEYLTGMQTRDASAMKLAGAGNIFFIPGMQDGRTAPGGSLDPEEIGYRKVKMQMLPNSSGSGFIINVWITEGSTGGPIVHHLIKNYVYTPTDGIPVDLKYGFAAGSETTTNYHEIRNLEINLPVADAISALPPVVTILPNDAEIKNSVNPLPTNLITPNGDGINDTWVVRNIDLFPNNKVRIFSSSGQEVYVKNNYDNEWDGKMAGIPLPLGTYYYIFEKGNSASPYKGYITIHQ